MNFAPCPCGGAGRQIGLVVSPTEVEELYFCQRCGGRFTRPLPGAAAAEVEA